MKLYHYCHTPFEIQNDWNYSRIQECFLMGCSLKPHGLWFSCEECDEQVNWREFCIDHDFGRDSLCYRLPIKLKEHCEVLLIQDEKTFVDFEEEFAVYRKKRRGSGLFSWESAPYKCIGVEWEEVEMLFDGIIICPYFRSITRNSGWYYGWDCASGCIWNLNSIEFGEWEKTPEELLVVEES